MKQSIVAASMALGALGAQAKAPEPSIQCNENQTSVVSAVEGVIGCKDVQKKGSYTHQATATSGPADVSTESTTPTPNNKNNIEIGGTDGGIAGAITFANGDIGIRLAADKDKKGEHAVVAAGFQISKNGYAVIGGSVANERSVGYDKDIQGTSAFVQINMTNLSPEIQRVFLEAITKNSKDKTLSVTSEGYTNVSVQDLGDVIRTITRTGEVITQVDHIGGRENQYGIGIELKTSQLGRLTLDMYHTVRSGTSSTTRGNLRQEYYFPNSAKVAVGLNSAGTVSLGGEVAISNNLTGTLATAVDTKNGNSRIYAGVKYYWNGLKGVFTPADTTSGKMQDTLNTINTRSNVTARGVESLGRTEETKTIIETVETSDKAKPKPEVKKPKPPVNPGTPNVAPVANADTATVVSGNAVTINALANDSDANGDTLTISSTTTPQHGTVSISGSNIVYTSTSGYVGADTFTYTVSDGNTTATATVTVNVTNTPRQNLSCTAPASQTFDDNGIDGQVINLGSITCQNTYGSALEYTISVSGGTTASVDANGNITVISPNFNDGLNHPQSGTINIKRVDDNNGTTIPLAYTVWDNA